VAASPRSKRSKESAHRSGAILVVEDDPSVREMLALLLEGGGSLHDDGRGWEKGTGVGRARGDTPRPRRRPDYNYLPKGLNGLQVVA